MWDRRYDREEYVYGTDPNQFLVQMADMIPPGAVLCLGEGEGRNAVWLAAKGYAVTAVDASSVGLGKAQRLAAAKGVAIATAHADLSCFDIQPEAWSGIVSIFCHVPPALRAGLHRRCVAGLRPGGVFLLEAYTPRQLAYGTGGPPSADLMMEAADLRRELAGLELAHLTECAREIHEGSLHNGKGAVVQVVAIKR